jgi:hypothetical protein
VTEEDEDVVAVAAVDDGAVVVEEHDARGRGYRLHPAPSSSILKGPSTTVSGGSNHC